MIDLHTHSTASDGNLSPTALVEHACKMNLEAIALTDHDTVGGVGEALAAGEKNGFEVIPGIEISAESPNSTLHILGYYIDYRDNIFLQNISELQKARAERNPGIIKKLQGLGIEISYEEVIEESGTGLVGRPHFAQVLLKKGYVKNTQDAFDRYLKKGAPAYEDKFRFPPHEAISHILNAGGIPVLAHPNTLSCQNTAELESIVSDLKKYGLKGIEVYYSEHKSQQTKVYHQIADKLGLLITGGSDFHGNNMK